METERPSLNFYDPVTQEHISLGFGYLSNEAMMPIFKGDQMLVMVPREVLITALQDGWGSQESGWWVDPAKN
jgi:hypothetical protein